MDIKELEEKYEIAIQNYLKYCDKLSLIGEIIRVEDDYRNNAKICIDSEGNKIVIELSEMYEADKNKREAIALKTKIDKRYDLEYKTIKIEKGWI